MGNLHRKGAAVAHFALHVDLAAHQFGELPGNGQSEARPFDGPLGCRFRPGEGFEEAVQIAWIDADPRILHGDAKHRLALHLLAADSQGDKPLVGVLHGIGQEVDHHPLDVEGVAVKGAGQIAVHLGLEHQPFSGGAFPANHHQVKDEVHRLVVLLHELQLARFDFGQIQDVVDQAEQGLARDLDVRGVAADLIGSAFP